MAANQTTQTQQQTTPAKWTIDVAHSSAEFAVKHMMIATVRGKIAIKSGEIVFDPANPAATRIEAELDAASISTGTADRDAHLRSPDFLHAEQHPTLRFVSTAVNAVDDEAFEVEGDLTIRDVTKRVTLEVQKEGEAKDPWGGWRAGLVATTTIDRKDWGLTWNMALEAGGILVAEKVKITLDLQAVRNE